MSQIRDKKSFRFPFGVFLIFRVSMWRHWLTIMDIKGGIDSLECWNSDVNGCLNNQRNYLKTNFWQYHAFIIKWKRQKLNTGHYGPAPTANVIPELDGNRVNTHLSSISVKFIVKGLEWCWFSFWKCAKWKKAKCLKNNRWPIPIANYWNKLV